MTTQPEKLPSLSGARTRIVLTDGSKTVELAWLKHTGTDVYLFHGPAGNHRSYHRSGEIHSVYDGMKTDKYIHVPLADLKGAFHLTTIGFHGNDISGSTGGIRHGGSEPSNVVAIDTQFLPSDDWIHILIGLLEPQRMDIIGSLIRTEQSVGIETRQLVFVTNVTPWVWITLSVGFPPDHSLNSQ